MKVITITIIIEKKIPVFDVGNLSGKFILFSVEFARH